MLNYLTNLLASQGFLPHGYCIQWSPGLLKVMVASDIIIAAAYFSMPIAILSFAKKRKDFPFKWVLWTFSGFISACGITHVVSAVNIWYPVYHIEAALSAATALISAITAFAVWKLLPKALELPSASALRTKCEELEAEIEKRIVAETLLAEVRGRVEAELLEKNRELEATNRAKSTFLANMSHEIRTPLNAITGMSHLIRREGVSAKQEDRLNKIEVASDHLVSTINDILDIAKIESGKFMLAEENLSVESLVNNVVSMLSDRAQGKGLTIHVHLACLPGHLVGDQTRIQQALLNYTINAIKFTDSGAVTISTFLVDEDESSVFVRFEVADTGMGIDKETQARLFNTFEQADGSTTRKYGGSGLGLSITKHLAHMMDGDAGVVSNVGLGSTFWFTARLKRNGKPKIDADGNPVAEFRIKEQFLGYRILIVDDDVVNLEVAKDQLESVGLIIDVAFDGWQAVARAKELVYPAILMDIQMPNLNGIEATAEIRKIPGYQHTPIIPMTANAFNEDRARCLAAGMTDFISKPFKPVLLFATLLRCLENSRIGK